MSSKRNILLRITNRNDNLCPPSQMLRRDSCEALAKQNFVEYSRRNNSPKPALEFPVRKAKENSAAVLTLSSRASCGIYDDASGKVIIDILKKNNFEVVAYDIITDDKELIKEKLINYADSFKVNVVLTTGGTGFGSKDVTPEATREVIEKEIPGIPELIRLEGFKKTKKAVLSRAIAGIRKKTLIINLPGSPQGAKESLEAVLDLIPHSIEMIFDKGHEK